MKPVKQKPIRLSSGDSDREVFDRADKRQKIAKKLLHDYLYDRFGDNFEIGTVSANDQDGFSFRVVVHVSDLDIENAS